MHNKYVGLYLLRRRRNALADVEKKNGRIAVVESII